jgi:hypothetical protein
MSLWQKKFADLLNIVVIVKTNLTTHKTAHVVLFSSDVTLGYDRLIDYYRLRFQLEFNLLGQIPRSLLRLLQWCYGRWHERLSA